jgi:ferredoxin
VAEEIEDAQAEGVAIQFLAAPLAILREAGRVAGVQVQRMVLGEADASGRRAPEPVPGDTYDLPATTVIAAVSQRPDWSGLEGLFPAPGATRPDSSGRIAEGVWGGGDAAGLGTVTRAIGQGRRAAEGLHAQLRGRPAPGPDPRQLVTSETMHLDYYAGGERARAGASSIESRFDDPTAEIQAGLGNEQFLAEIGRCLSCGSCMGCGNCWMYCNAHSYARSDTPQPGAYFIFNQTHCEGCAKCIEVCPCGYLSRHA